MVTEKHHYNSTDSYRNGSRSNVWVVKDFLRLSLVSTGFRFFYSELMSNWKEAWRLELPFHALVPVSSVSIRRSIISSTFTCSCFCACFPFNDKAKPFFYLSWTKKQTPKWMNSLGGQLNNWIFGRNVHREERYGWKFSPFKGIVLLQWEQRQG